MLDKLKNTISKNIVKILLLLSCIITIVSLIYALVYDIQTPTVIERVIFNSGIFIPAMIGLWIYSNRIKATRKRLSIVIKFGIIYVLFTFLVVIILSFLGY